MQSYGGRLTLRGLANKMEIMLIILATSENRGVAQPVSQSVRSNAAKGTDGN